MKCLPRQSESIADSEPRRAPAAVSRPHSTRRAGLARRGASAAQLVFGALSLGVLAFGACTLTSDDIDPPLVEHVELLPDASTGPAGGCTTELDCEAGEVCTAGACVAAASSPPDVDAGVAAPCVGSDCSIEAPLPLAPSCEDGTRNGDEGGVDCGGPCAPCAAGATCLAASDCESGVCSDAGTCPAPSCDDGVANQDETDSDCGGGCERRCGPGSSCRVDADCEAGLFCPAATQSCTPVSCGDGVRNGAEVLADCGGGSCAGCPDGSECSENGDCESGVCGAGTCATPTCDDDVRNQDETDVDCGGGCADCPNGDGCAVAGDCQSGVCRAGACAPPTCNDGVLNQNETDVDCGGNCNRNCAVGDGCRLGGDCQTGVCGGAGCGQGGAPCCQAPSCNDGVRNGNELAVDCGAGCGPCPVGTPCTADAQCELAFCQQGECADPGSCVDGTQNGRETGVDCGGADCLLCDLSACVQAADCLNGNCALGVCISCGDGVQNGSETGVDCGGADPACRRCNTGERCGSNDDCNVGALCIAGTCG